MSGLVLLDLQALVLMPARLRVPLPCPDLPQLVLNCITAVQKHESAVHQVTGCREAVGTATTGVGKH
jgi:hypothetical protein